MLAGSDEGNDRAKLPCQLFINYTRIRGYLTFMNIKTSALTFDFSSKKIDFHIFGKVLPFSFGSLLTKN